MKQIAQAFIKAKREFSPALKTHTNPAFRSRYADLSACLEAVNDALLNNGIAVYQETCEDATGVTVETVFLHESGELIRGGKLHVPAAKQDPQGYGSALTYCRRYSLMAACGIAAEDDDGNAASKTFTKPVAKPAEKPVAKPKALSDDELDAACIAIAECDDMDALKGIFTGAFKRADEGQQAVLTAAKDKRKTELDQPRKAA